MRHLLRRTLFRRCGLSAILTFISFLALLAGFCWALAGSTPAIGASVADGYTIYYVAPNEDCGGMQPCYDSIQAAVDAVDEPTDVVKVASGTYSEIVPRGIWQQVVLILRPLTLRGGYSPADWDTSRPSTNLTIIDPRGGGRGVAITSVPMNQTVTLDGFTITNGNAAGLGGYSYMSIPLGDAGGGIYVIAAAATIKNCELHHNKATNSTFTPGIGGALFVLSGTVTLQDNIIRDNTASTNYAGDGGGIGMAYCPRPSTITGNTVQHNNSSLVARGYGGGIFLNSCQVTLSGNTVQDNVAGTAGEGRGGGLYAFDSGLTLSANRFYSNTANIGTVDGFGLGGGLYIERYDWHNVSTSEAVTLTDNTIENNLGAKSGRGIGGGMLLKVTIADIRGNTLRNNVAGWAEGAGGGLFLGPSRAMTHTTQARIAVATNTFQGNRAATSGAGKGGGIFVGALPPIGGIWEVISGATFTDNTTSSNTASTSGTGKGGGMFLTIGTNTVTVTLNSIQNNLASDQAEGYGGGVYLETTNASVVNNTIKGNTASSAAAGYGGGLYLDSGSATLTNNSVQSNTASSSAVGYGGGLSFRYSFPTLSGNQILSNTASSNATGRGGGLYAALSHINSVRDTLRGNNASRTASGYGGGLALESCDYVEMKQSTIVQNTASLASGATGLGGGLYSANSAPLFLTNDIIGANAARNEGSGLWLEGLGEATLIHTTIANNTGGGQGLYGTGELTIICTNTIVAGHTQTGVLITEGASIRLAYTLWYGNGADRGGMGTITHTADFSGNPDFVAAPSGNFHLGPSSAAIDKGINAGVSIDIDGNPRPYDRGYDLGADEFAGGVPPKKYLYIPFLRK